ncbi:hypothetical protein WJX72_004359 [[Myrmecia] bisecta]|uniref:Protein kinase domain-containing protein n=1 Tax=[Myrmecia] bisecta TaxID=41462 RepID=A0AAW1PPZ9_9CHLO
MDGRWVSDPGFANGLTNFEDVYRQGGWVGWKESEPLCSSPWTGVACTPDGRVLNLTYQGIVDPTDRGLQLIGPLPPVLGTLDRLQYLDLGLNNLTGTLSADWGQSLSDLRFLNLTGNSLTGALPDSYGQNGAFSNLTAIDLSGTQLSGTLPLSWGDPHHDNGSGALASLQTLRLDACGLAACYTGPLPRFWGLLLENLTSLNLTHQPGIAGSLPTDWGDGVQFRSLRYLSLAETNVNGSIPGLWFNNTPSFNQLRALQLNNAELSGSLPYNWGNKQGMPVLQMLYLQNNNLSGALPHDWPPSLKLANVAPQRGPGFCGVIPAGFPAVFNPSLAPLTGRFLLTCAEEDALAPPAGHTGISQGGIAGITVGAVGIGAFFTLVGILGVHQYRRYRMRSLLPRHSPSPPHSRNSVGAGSAHGVAKGIGHEEAPDSYGEHCYIPAEPRLIDSVLCGCGARSIMLSDLPPEVHAMPPYSGGSANAHSQPTSDRPPKSAKGPDARAVEARAAAAALLTETSSDEMVPELLDWDIKPEDIEICQRFDGSDWSLGSGAYGMVYKATLFGVHTVAVKKLRDSTPREQDNFRKEVAILKGCRNVNIVMFLGACLQPGQTMLVTEFMPRGDLWQALGTDHLQQFSWYRRGKSIALDVARGLHFMHRLRMVHFDLKSPNILLARDHTAKIADVGLSRIIRSERTRLSAATGTWDWAAPEMLRGEECDSSADIYSFGVVLWEICSGERPLRGQMPPPRVPEQCPQVVADLILRCRSPNSVLRPTSRELCDILKAAVTLPAPPAMTDS